MGISILPAVNTQAGDGTHQSSPTAAPQWFPVDATVDLSGLQRTLPDRVRGAERERWNRLIPQGCRPSAETLGAGGGQGSRMYRTPSGGSTHHLVSTSF